MREITAKFPSLCKGCGSAIRKDSIILYDDATKAAYHKPCAPAEPEFHFDDALALAERLGFIEYRPDMAADGLLSRMSRTDRGPTTGRPEPPPHEQPRSPWPVRESPTG